MILFDELQEMEKIAMRAVEALSAKLDEAPDVDSCATETVQRNVLEVGEQEQAHCGTSNAPERMEEDMQVVNKEQSPNEGEGALENSVAHEGGKGHTAPANLVSMTL